MIKTKDFMGKNSEKIAEITEPSGTQIKSKKFYESIFDFIVAAIGLLILSPLFGLIAIGIKRESSGPVFYNAKRVGQHGKIFNMLKFRTMYEDSDSEHGPILTAFNDPRVTPFGRWLRKTKLNELPQLWNIIKGDMCLVGPRPEDPGFVEQWNEHIRTEILSLKPGITSPASILYRDEDELLKSSNIFDDYIKAIMPNKLRLDQLYVKNHNFFTDLDVCFMTILVLLPQLHNITFEEKTVFSGPVFQFFSRYLSWFITDFLVAFSSVSFAVLVWRASQPIHLGFMNSLLMAFLVAILLSIVSTVFGLQRIIWRYATPTHVLDIAFTVMVTNIILFLSNFLWMRTVTIPLHFLTLFGLLTFMGLVAVRYRERLITGLATRWLHYSGGHLGYGERVLVVGAGSGGELAIWMLNKCEFASVFSIAGIVDDDYRKRNVQMINYPILGTTYDIPNLVEKMNIGLILFAISNCDPLGRKRIIELCESTDARTVIIPDLMKVFLNSDADLVKVPHE